MPAKGSCSLCGLACLRQALIHVAKAQQLAGYFTGMARSHGKALSPSVGAGHAREEGLQRPRPDLSAASLDSCGKSATARRPWAPHVAGAPTLGKSDCNQV